MKANFGYTNIDIIVSVALIASMMLVVALLANPWQRYATIRDWALADGVRDYMEAMFELKDSSPQTFWEIVYQGINKKVPIGSCQICVNVESVLVPNYLDKLPIDTNGGYSSENTGYYLQFQNDVLEIGATSPHIKDMVRLLWFVK